MPMKICMKLLLINKKSLNFDFLGLFVEVQNRENHKMAFYGVLSYKENNNENSKIYFFVYSEELPACKFSRHFIEK